MNNPEIMSIKFNIPIDICRFLTETFGIMEIRGNVGNWNSIRFEVRSKETPHNNPHVHASYGEYNISIDIITLETIGNLPLKKKKTAIKWVEDNKEYLLTKWNTIAMSSKLPWTSSTLDFEKVEI